MGNFWSGVNLEWQQLSSLTPVTHISGKGNSQGTLGWSLPALRGRGRSSLDFQLLNSWVESSPQSCLGITSQYLHDVLTSHRALWSDCPLVSRLSVTLHNHVPTSTLVTTLFTCIHFVPIKPSRNICSFIQSLIFPFCLSQQNTGSIRNGEMW